MPYLYQEIAESIRRRIAAGELVPGDRLPAVRAMAQQWHCTPGTVNRAYRELGEQGLVSGHRGGGTRIREYPAAGNRPQFAWAKLVNRAEQYLIEALNSGQTANEAQSALAVAISRWQALQAQSPIERKRPPSARILRFAGSHDLTVELLAQELSQSEPEYRLELEFVGSLGGLIALARGEADITGIHLWDASTATYNLPFVRRVLTGQRLALVTLIQRQLGFIVPQGNPQRIEELPDLTRPGVRWLNRQRGSGTRIWLDEQLRRARIVPVQIKGYGDEGATHMVVAQAVQSGRATAGLGIQAAALAYGLSFIPQAEEVYQLVIPEAVWASPIWQQLLAIIGSGQFRAAVDALGGYNTSSMGEVTWV